jgi:hypothetical protein
VNIVRFRSFSQKIKVGKIRVAEMVVVVQAEVTPVDHLEVYPHKGRDAFRSSTLF